MCFLNFIKKQNRIGFSPDGFGQVTALIISDISRRSPDQTGHRVFFHILGHIDADHRLLIVEHELRQSPGQFGFSHTGGPQENERSNRAVRILQTRACPSEGRRHSPNAVILSDHAHLQAFIHMDQFLHIAFHHAGKRDAGPVGNHFRHIFGIYLLFQHLIVFLYFLKFFLKFLKFTVEFHQFAIADFRRARQIAFTLCVRFLNFQCFHLALDLLNLFNDVLFRGPVHLHLVHAGFEFGQFLFDLFAPLFCGLVRIFFQGLLFNFQLNDFPVDRINFRRHGIQFDPQTRRGFINQIHRLVRQKPVGDIPVRQGSRGHNGGILDTDAVMHFIALLQTT